ncbi:MAG: NAD(P)/FAD-dependent oxidoreductase [Solirubrobacteraceae bacterium]
MEASFWLDQLPSRQPRAALIGERTADVCIVGGGFTGLWTAYELRRASPDLEVVVLEARHVGFGASGRNGGWVLGRISGSTDAWERHGGPGAVRAMARAITDTVDEVGAAVARERIECDWRQGGTLHVAQSELQLRRLHELLESERLELGEELSHELLDESELAGRIHIDRARGALFSPHCARVQPAKLVAGLAQAAERAGAQIFESSRVTLIEPGVARTAGGVVRARHVLRATEGYTADLPGTHRLLMPVNSSMIVTEPLSESDWDRIGWDGAETLLDGVHLYTYSQRTADGRIAIGGRGVPYRFGSRTDREGPVPAKTVQDLRGRLGELFGSLRDVAVARAWHGVLGVARDWCPTVGLDRATGLGWAGGYAGEGVAAANLAGRTLRDLVLGHDTELTRLPWVGSPAREWEPEPLRFIAARGIYGLYGVADRRESVSGRESKVAAVADRVAGR